MEYTLARHNMIEQQIRTWDVLDQTTLNLLEDLHREDFIPEPYKALALADTTLPLWHNQLTLPPRVEARIMQAVAVQKHEKALEIGTGCGYLTALLAKSCDFVYSVDIFPEFTKEALEKLQAAQLSNIELVTRDGLLGWPEQGPYDVIVVTGSLPVFTHCFHEQLTAGGRLFLMTGTAPAMQANLITRIDDDSFTQETLFETEIAALVGAEQADHFAL